MKQNSTTYPNVTRRPQIRRAPASRIGLAEAYDPRYIAAVMRLPSSAALWAALALFALVPTFGASSVAAQANAETVTTQRVREMLSTFEAGPSRMEWRALGSGTVGVLAALYNDADEPGFVRLRAVAAVANFPIPATRTFLHAVATTPHQGDLFISQAISSLAEAFGPAALDEIAPFLSNRFPVVREAAIHALGAMNRPAARRLLEARRTVETESSVRETLQNVLAEAAH